MKNGEQYRLLSIAFVIIFSVVLVLINESIGSGSIKEALVLTNSSNLYTVVINPGHSQGYDPGAVYNGVEEADLNAQMAAKLGTMLQKSGYNVYLTQPVSGFVGKTLMTNAEAFDYHSIPDRINSVDPDFALSIHCNARAGNPFSISGYELYWSSAKWSVESSGTYEVPGLWGDRFDSGYLDKTPCWEARKSQAFANLLKDNLIEGLGSDLAPAPDCIHERDDAIPAGTSCPAILIEAGYISNPYDAAYLSGRDNQTKMMSCIKKSIDQVITRWQYENDNWYLVNGLGEKQTGWQRVKGHWYYMNKSDGKCLIGLKPTEENKRYNYETGILEKDQQQQFKGRPYDLATGEDDVIQRLMGRSTSKEKESEGEWTESTPIMGAQQITQYQLFIFSPQVADFPVDLYHMSLSDFLTLIIEEANIEGVRPEIVFAQTLIDTNFYSDAFESDVRTAIRSRVQYLKAYASKDKLNQDYVDEGFNSIKRASAPTIGDLRNVKTDDPDYVDKLLSLLNSMSAMIAER